METIDLCGVQCRIKRSGRRSVCVRVLEDGTPEILAPYRMDAAAIVRLLGKYAPKVQAESESRRRTYEQKQAFVLDYGSRVRFLGGDCEIRKSDCGACFYEGAFYIPQSLSADEIKSAVTEIYKRSALEYISARTAAISEMMGLSPAAVKINSARSHWASCSKKNSLNFSWYCMMASRDEVDYIIVHELCHIKEFNHSPKFWREVAKFCPEYKKHRTALRTLAIEIRSEGWEF